MKASPSTYTAYTGRTRTSSSTVSSQYSPNSGGFRFFAYVEKPFSNSVMVSREKKLSQNALNWIQKLQSFEQLKDNWDGYGAVAPLPQALKKAIALVKDLDAANVETYFSAPGPDGEVLVEIQSADKSIEFYVFSATQIEYCGFRNEVDEIEGQLDMTKLDGLLQWMKNKV